jgi:hypothetical protein
LTADDIERPLVEAGEGTSEGFEQALDEQIDASQPSDTASPYQQQIDEVIEQQDNPFAGESEEALGAFEQPVDYEQPGSEQGPSATGFSSEANQEERDPGDPSERDDRP